MDFTLENILNNNLNPEILNTDILDTPTATTTLPSDITFCIECEDQPAFYNCSDCSDFYCQVCFTSQHRKGNRKTHAFIPLNQPIYNQPLTNLPSPALIPDNSDIPYTLDIPDSSQNNLFYERSKFIPLRFNFSERKYLRLLEAALQVSEYTDKIDVIIYSNKTKRIVAQIKELCSIISGLVLAADYNAGQKLFQDRDFQDNSQFIAEIFELGRRHKIMNPDKMRDSYGKLMYLLQDSQMPQVKDMLQFSCVSDIKTVYSLLHSKNALNLLMDDLMPIATQEIITTGKSRSRIQSEIKSKEKAIENLAGRYSNSDISSDEIKQCLYSIGDNNAFLRVNRDPCETMIQYLSKYFNPDNAEPGYSLSIQYGRQGARLSHDHEKQYHFVMQSLSLWREIQHDMFMLWCLAEKDLLSEENMYRLVDTGQGLNRVQSSPRVSRLMHTILNRAQRSVGYWVGSSVIHLGDHNVPNAFMFIDKYTQIFHILLPICNCLNQFDEMKKNAGLNEYVESTFGGFDKLKKDILLDFFRHAFDGSGADNFFDAGSCIDGRLTSAWNWCSQLEKKDYFHVFLLSGFSGFDGKF